MLTDEMLSRAFLLVQSEPQHDLRLGLRCQLLSSFDEHIGGAGRRRRTRLAALAVEKVLPLWESFFSADHTPREALDLAEKVLGGVVTSAVAESEMGRLWTHCDDLMWRHADKQNTIMVGYAAIQAVREALSEEHFGCEHVSDDSNDIDIEPYDSDSSHFAAVAYSGGASWEEGSDPQKCLEFWTWWLTSAVRTAMTVA